MLCGKEGVERKGLGTRLAGRDEVREHKVIIRRAGVRGTEGRPGRVGAGHSNLGVTA